MDANLANAAGTSCSQGIIVVQKVKDKGQLDAISACTTVLLAGTAKFKNHRTGRRTARASAVKM